MTVRSETLSPTFTCSACTTPLNGLGTAIVALSDSSVMSGCSGVTVSPGLTSTSITGTSLKSPMSGTRTSATPAGACVGAGGGVTEGRGAGAATAPSVSTVSRTLPSLTLSPTFTLSVLTRPAIGAGTSIVALSDSSVTSGSSAFTRSPGFTKISITGTSVKSPMSGTLISVVAPMSPPRAGSFTPSTDPADRPRGRIS